jgi:hypothetical protein
LYRWDPLPLTEPDGGEVGPEYDLRCAVCVWFAQQVMFCKEIYTNHDCLFRSANCGFKNWRERERENIKLGMVTCKI